MFKLELEALILTPVENGGRCNLDLSPFIFRKGLKWSRRLQVFVSQTRKFGLHRHCHVSRHWQFKLDSELELYHFKLQ